MFILPDANGKAPAGLVTRATAAKAGLAPGMKLLAVSGRCFTPDRLKSATAATKPAASSHCWFFKTHALDFKGRARDPRLDPGEGKADGLAEIVKASAK